MFDKKKYDQKFQKDNYDRIALNVKKGDKEKMSIYAKKNGFDSLTDYIKSLIYNDMNIEKTIIHAETIEQNGDNNTINIG